jgi:hypothetical protein
MAWVATAIVGSAVVGGLATAYGANQAASAQENAAAQAAATAQNAQNISLGMYNTTRSDLAPYRAIGTTAATDLTNQLPALTAPITMDEATLENTPGYQFNLTQGEKAVTNSTAARGLGTSGAALKGAATYATGLADSTYQNQFNNANTNQTNAFTRLSSLVNTGETAAAAGGAAGTAAANTATTAAGQIGSAQTQAGTAAAAGANATGGAIASTANGIGGYTAYKGLYGTTPGGTVANGGITLGNSGGPTAFS